MSRPDLGGKPAVYLKHSIHGGAEWFHDDATVLAYYGARGWEIADPPDEEAEVAEAAAAAKAAKVSPESPAPKKTSKAAKAAETEEV